MAFIVFSAQGRTVATAHALVGVGMTREALYVAATRAREANRLYVDVEPEPAGADMAHGQAERLSAREVLVAVASRRGADLSAHQTMATEWAKAASFDQLVKEHQSLVAAATARRWESALYGAGFSGAVLAQARQSPEWAGLLSALRDAEDRGLDVGSALPELAKLAVGPTEDTAAMLRARLRRWEKLAGGNWQPRQDLVAGLVPRASGIDDPDLAKPSPSARMPSPSAPWTWPSRPYAAARPGPRPLARRPSARPSPRPGGTAWPSSPPIGTAGVSTPRASSARPRVSVRSPKPPTAPGRNGRDRKLLAWPGWIRRRQPRHKAG